jgi:2-dehydro-3-deoxyphosphooctonate aldolase (KDO 8-P synthase)
MKSFGFPIIFDSTHSAQLPGGNGSSTGGMREMIPYLSRAAVAAGCDGIFMEVHDDVEKAKSDSTTQWPLDKLEPLLKKLILIRKSIL